MLYMESFKRKYPYADYSKFYEDVDDNMHIKVFTHTDIGMVAADSPLFLKSEYKKWLYTNKPKPYEWPKIWNTGGSVSSYNGRADLGYNFQNFRVYVIENDYFMSNLPSVSASWYKGKHFDETVVYDVRDASLNYKKEPYFAMICGAYVSSYLCGLSLQNIAGGVPPVIRTVIKYHFYYQIRKFMKTPNLLDKYNFFFVKGHIPTKRFWVVSKNRDEDGNIYSFYGHKEYSYHDYLSFISKKNNGLTKIGEQLLQESIESFYMQF